MFTEEIDDDAPVDFSKPNLPTPSEVNHPAHYTQYAVGGKPLECIDVLEALDLPFHLANAFKYIWRHREKGGVKDLEKARWYLDRYIAQHKSAVIK